MDGALRRYTQDKSNLIRQNGFAGDDLPRQAKPVEALPKAPSGKVQGLRVDAIQ
jgi:hypothetical protein